ncbi:MAG: hypothetical protein AB7N24_02755 [Dehalococcoidia bacterium]
MKEFRRVAETVVDSRRRISLGKAGVTEETRYSVSVSDDGDILLTPLATIPARERFLWEHPKLLASVRRGMEQAARGEIHDLGSFSQYLDDED